jgi:16S rRNA (adenine1518-N6/adenine1519-N6)-dimethyltransferase
MNEVRAKKALGQHFLTDKNIAKRIADALGQGVVLTDVRQPEDALRESDRTVPPESERIASSGSLPIDSPYLPADVLEIGPGTGMLTQFLLERDDITLHGAEIDRESVAWLRRHYPDFAPRLIEGDFLTFRLEEMFPSGVRIIGNFPYNISSQIFFKVLENRDLIPEVVCMLQREVAQRIAEPPGSRTYGILSVLLQAWYDIEYLFTVSEGVFNPPPKVKSAVVRLRRNGVQSLNCDERLFVRVVKAAFGQRRKMLKNPLRAAFGDFGGAQHPFFTRRAEELSVADFVELTRWVEATSKA